VYPRRYHEVDLTPEPMTGTSPVRGGPVIREARCYAFSLQKADKLGLVNSLSQYQDMQVFLNFVRRK